MHNLLKKMESAELMNSIDRWAAPACTVLLFIAGTYFLGQLLYAWRVIGRIVEVAR